MSTGILALMIPIIVIFIAGLVAVAAIMTAHQRKMAELVQKNQNDPGLIDELRAMRGELADLRDRVNQQTLAIESKNSAGPQRTEPPDVPTRLTE